MNEAMDLLNSILNEGSDATIKKLATEIKSSGKALMSLGPVLEKMFGKKNVEFTLVGAAHYRIKHKGKTIIIVNKKYVDNYDVLVGEIAVGYDS